MKFNLKSYLLWCVVALGAIIGCSSCNSDDTWESDPLEQSGVAVKGFTLRPNKSILNNLDSVFFSIDLIECRIFNANPLPYDTDISHLAVKISSDECSVAQLFVNGSDSEGSEVIDYLATPEAKINFANGPVTLRLVSKDGVNQRDYKISVNVATVVRDSLYWDKLQSGNLMGVANMTRAKTVKIDDKALTLSISASGAVGLSTFIPADESGGGSWDQAIVTPAFTDVNTTNFGTSIDVESFNVASDGSLYLLDTYGHLHRSTDSGATFSIVDSGWKSITSPYLEGVIGVKDNAGSLTFAAYPTSIWLSIPGAIATDFPISGVSSPAVFSTKWTPKPQVIIAGGRTASGTLTGASWAFDGNKWAKISSRLPQGTGYALTNYVIAETDTTNWQTYTRNVIIAFGGNGLTQMRTVWISRDMGVNWQQGSKEVQLPDYIPSVSGGSLIVFDKTLEADVVTPLAVKPITSWVCPYLYLFGGYDTSGNLNNQYWSGVINHLRFKPLQ